MTIGFIGAGNMARSLAGGLLNNGWAADRLLLSDPDAEQRRGAGQALGVQTFADNHDLVERAEVLVLAVKPQALKAVSEAIASTAQKKKPLVVSIAAGIRVHDIERWLAGTGGRYWRESRCGGGGGWRHDSGRRHDQPRYFGRAGSRRCSCRSRSGTRRNPQFV